MEKPVQEHTKEEKILAGREEIVEQLKQIKNMVSDFKEFIPKIRAYLQQLCQNFKAGQVAKHFTAWSNITSDKEILSNVLGVAIECTEPPIQHKLYAQKFCPSECSIIDAEVNKLLDKGVVIKVKHEKGQILSNIFLRPKPDGTHRLILNLKKFNETVAYHHFKMDSIHTIIKLVVPNCFMASLDMKDAYYSIPIRASHQKFLCFKWKGHIYQFTCLPNGLSSAPRQFTKILKPALATLHKMGHISVAHIDDCYLQGQTYEQCVANVIDTLLLLDSLGLVIHPEKSVLMPSQEIVTLGFLINSVTMTIRLTTAKATDLKKECESLLQSNKTPTIRWVAKVIGKIVVSFPGVMYGPLYYRALEHDKSLALKKAKGNFDATMSLSQAAKKELWWWVKNVETAYQTLSRKEPQHHITTDASLSGWGAECKGVSTGGTWTESEASHHINYLEMLAILLGLQTFGKDKNGSHIRILCDNTTAVNILNHMGTSHSEPCNRMAKMIWEWCISKSIWISIAHIPGKQNLVADYESRRNQRESEWMLNKALLSDALGKLNFQPEQTIPKIYIISARPKCFCYRCIHVTMGKFKILCIPTI